MKTAELTGALLDYWVARAAGVDAVMSDPHRNGSRNMVTFYGRDHDGHLDGRSYKPSEHWSDGGEIIEDHAIGFHPISDAEWMDEEHITCRTGRGPTPLIAAMRAYVASVYGDEVSGDDPATRAAAQGEKA